LLANRHQIREIIESEELRNRQAPLKVTRSQARWVEIDAKDLPKKHDQLEFDLNLTEGLLFRLHQLAAWVREASYIDNPAPEDLGRSFAVEPLRCLNPDEVRLFE
jgi:hypothetical protein